MTTLTAWAFPGVDDAEAAIQRLDALQLQGHITIDDAALVSWEPGRRSRRRGNCTTQGSKAH